MRLKSIPNFPGYLAGDDGHIYSSKPVNGGGVPPVTPRRLARRIIQRYRMVRIINDGRRQNVKVSYLVLLAFVGPRPDGYEICHGSWGRLVDTPDNLSWGTKSKNCGEDKLRDGSDHRGDKNGNARLTSAQVRDIRSSAGKIKGREIARRFGVAESTVSAIRHNVIRRFEEA